MSTMIVCDNPHDGWAIMDRAWRALRRAQSGGPWWAPAQLLWRIPECCFHALVSAPPRQVGPRPPLDPESQTFLGVPYQRVEDRFELAIQLGP
jgi:hypothetical protein